MKILKICHKLLICFMFKQFCSVIKGQQAKQEENLQ